LFIKHLRTIVDKIEVTEKGSYINGHEALAVNIAFPVELIDEYVS
jgi:hypothetical protein